MLDPAPTASVVLSLSRSLSCTQAQKENRNNNKLTLSGTSKKKKNSHLKKTLQEALSVDFALVGAEAVVESGGAVSKLGTYGVAVAAKAASGPFYVAAESYKFSRLYPLGQKGLPEERKHVDFGPLLPRAVRVDNPSRDYTPPSFISLLFTDLGVLTPAAVSDELIQLYS